MKLKVSSVMTLFDAQIGQTSKVQGDQYKDIALKGFNLLGKPAEPNIKSPDHRAPGQHHAGVKPGSQQGAKVTHRYFLRTEDAGRLVDIGPTSQATGRKSPTSLEDATSRRAAAGVRQPKAVLGPTLPVFDRPGLKPTTENANSKEKSKTELSA